MDALEIILLRQRITAKTYWTNWRIRLPTPHFRIHIDMKFTLTIDSTEPVSGGTWNSHRLLLFKILFHASKKFINGRASLMNWKRNGKNPTLGAALETRKSIINFRISSAESSDHLSENVRHLKRRLKALRNPYCFGRCTARHLKNKTALESSSADRVLCKTRRISYCFQV